ncbi:NAD(P)-dependent dehydrogenase (short-subunit alcohol dehydrogenase family) [Altererythrobacter atlanticus]|uniref:Oxidoreductase YciK n=1 Tax=Croceibacterium atlanticum TaxID=1267766 RepID=A0A0F7KQC4_9SPHN|nr:SDR family NAD(P)-dependent oxidoreductase [Croceibacterium atlanticum]AKH41352.1 putative oxidoreductase YciK [Croceibacterium atlanticum]MBB5734134.1 NAD(P)-dependent dehydrogenase (short-subunit alcohol dehydrogenase family) [Croceibacterium atlanticum]
MAESKPLEGRIALVTGASRGIGAATAKALAAAGAHVVITARKVRDLEAVEDAIHEAGGTATIAPMDLTESDSIARLSAAIAERWDRLDILVIGAAMLPSLTPVTQIEAKPFNQALTLNVLATQALLAAFDPLLKRSKAGRVIGLTSSVGATPRAYWGAYGATKAAFDTLLSCYAQEVERISETRVAILDPGATRTEMRARAYPGEDPQTVKAPETVADHIIEMLQRDWHGLIRERVENPA